MFQRNHLPWRDHPIEPLFPRFFEVLRVYNPEAKILDIGCGDGWASIYAAKIGFHAWGLDSSPTAIKLAKDAAASTKVQELTDFVVGDALNLPYEPHYFDAIIDGGLFHHIVPENRDKYIQNLLNVLATDGYFYLSAFSKSTSNEVGYHFSVDEIKDIFGEWFKVVEFAEDEVDPQAPFRTVHLIMQRLETQ